MNTNSLHTSPIPSSHSNKTVASSVARFSKKTVYVVVMIAGAILFPITAIIAGIITLYQSRHHKSLADRIKAVTASIMFPLPVVGPILYHLFSHDNTIAGLYLLTLAHEEKILKNQLLLISIPFLSAAVTALFFCAIMFNDEQLLYQTS